MARYTSYPAKHTGGPGIIWAERDVKQLRVLVFNQHLQDKRPVLMDENMLMLVWSPSPPQHPAPGK